MNTINGIRRRTWAEIDMDALEYNYKAIRSLINKKTKLCCVIKANAYGHGAVEVARLYSQLGADFFAVSNIEEALQLRQNHIDLPILILGYTPPECAKLLSDYNISQCVYSLEYARELSYFANEHNVKIKIHIKIDTGMGRIGFVCRSENQTELQDILKIRTMKCFDYEGIFTHFSVADEGDRGHSYTLEQYQNFMYAVDYLKQHGFVFRIHHCANSAGCLDYPELQFDMVRAGIILYGLAPSSQIRNNIHIKPVMALKTVISHIKNISPGETVSYGRTFSSHKSCRLATLPIGYADGLSRSSTGYKVLVSDTPAPIVGRICMDQLMINTSDIDCHPGDIVTIFGSKQGNTADDVAEHTNTINYEIVCNIGERVPRVYIKDSQIIYWLDGLCPL